MAGERWAWRNQAYVAPEWVPDVDRRVAANRWVSRAIFLALASPSWSYLETTRRGPR
jgi:hypothetical protein